MIQGILLIRFGLLLSLCAQLVQCRRKASSRKLYDAMAGVSRYPFWLSLRQGLILLEGVYLSWDMVVGFFWYVRGTAGRGNNGLGLSFLAGLRNSYVRSLVLCQILINCAIVFVWQLLWIETRLSMLLPQWKGILDHDKRENLKVGEIWYPFTYLEYLPSCRRKLDPFFSAEEDAARCQLPLPGICLAIPAHQPWVWLMGLENDMLKAF